MGAVAIVLIALGTLVAACAVALSAALALVSRERTRVAEARAALDLAARSPVAQGITPVPAADTQRHLAFARETLDQAESRLHAAARRHPLAARILNIAAQAPRQGDRA